ncbi:unnamed protein product [Caenorhabditis sp. 36 PRJEB53466]|nr:unnamed protein product [Caenorhabditis sp. 36 PRJEB53466]
MEKLRQELEVYKRMYFKAYPNSSKQEETEAVVKKAEEFITNVLPTVIRDNKSRATDINQKALLLFEAGRLYNVLDEHNETAERFLSKSVKMNPKNAEAWHELGECVLKRRDFEFAQSCFKIALELDRSAQNLCSLAVGTRLVALELPEPAQTDMRSKAMDLIIEARRLDSSFGPANLAFATGLFYCFFKSANGELHYLDKVIENYKKALECELTKTDVQVYMNMAVCLKFMEKYDEAIDSYQKAVEYDSRNEFQTIEKLKSCTGYLLKFAEAIQKKGKVKAKRMQEMVNELKKQPPAGADQFRAKVIGNVAHEETIPVALVGVDASGEVFGITVYNCLANFGFVIGDTITIAKPDYRSIENLDVLGETSTTITSLKWIRVANPTQIKKNGSPLPESVLARAVASTQT